MAQTRTTKRAVRTSKGKQSKRRTGRRVKTKQARVASAHVTLGRHDGWGAAVSIAERAGGATETSGGLYQVSLAKQGGGGGTTKRRAVAAVGRTCAALAAAAHHKRTALLCKLLEGPATYRALQKTTQLKPGPLYHHINQLRLAGLILPKQRDLYELTRGGRNLILVALAAAPLFKDGRRRPLPPVNRG